MKRARLGLGASEATHKRLGAFEKQVEIGRGTYGTVYLGYHCESRARVAIKKVLGRVEVGRREAAFLAKCRGAEHVVQLLEVVERHDKLYLVLEYMDSDLETLVSATEAVPQLGVAQVKAYLRMLLQGVQELHSRHILHRDLKPNNLLVSKTQRRAKITDFGMATFLDADEQHGEDAGDTDVDDATPSERKKKKKRSLQVVTRAYRAPEIFFGEDAYGSEVDMWSVGCIFAEMLLRRPFFDGSSDIDQLSRIFTALGSPSENGWSGAARLPFHLKFKDTHPTPLAEQFPMLSPAGVELLGQLLALDPKKRVSAADALQHAFFREEPEAVASEELQVLEMPEREERIERVEQAAAAAAAAAQDSDGDDGFVIKGRRIM